MRKVAKKILSFEERQAARKARRQRNYADISDAACALMAALQREHGLAEVSFVWVNRQCVGVTWCDGSEGAIVEWRSEREAYHGTIPIRGIPSIYQRRRVLP